MKSFFFFAFFVENKSINKALEELKQEKEYFF